jgi:hypothetical protein
MLTTPHATTGIALGVAISNPILVIPAAIASHFILDCIPHWQETLAPYIPTKKTYIRVPLDIALAIAITFLSLHIQPTHAAAIWTGAISANIPDIDTITIILPKLKQGIVTKYWDWHCKIQEETASLWGVVTQLAVIIFGLVIVYTF